MKIEESFTRKILISDIENLDPVSVYLEDFKPRHGKITISCYDKSWNSYWGGMGDKTISEFFLSCDNHYLAKNLSSTRSSVTDYDSLGEKIITHYGDDIEWDLKDDIEALGNDDAEWDAWIRNNGDTMTEVFGEEWYYYGLPTKENPQYAYLCRIINAVKYGLKSVKGFA